MGVAEVLGLELKDQLQGNREFNFSNLLRRKAVYDVDILSWCHRLMVKEGVNERLWPAIFGLTHIRFLQMWKWVKSDIDPVPALQQSIILGNHLDREFQAHGASPAIWSRSQSVTLHRSSMGLQTILSRNVNIYQNPCCSHHRCYSLVEFVIIIHSEKSGNDRNNFRTFGTSSKGPGT